MVISTGTPVKMQSPQTNRVQEQSPARLNRTSVLKIYVAKQPIEKAYSSNVSKSTADLLTKKEKRRDRLVHLNYYALCFAFAN